jgi:hypothetical protein
VRPMAKIVSDQAGYFANIIILKIINLLKLSSKKNYG